jgi:hypothetical protein
MHKIIVVLSLFLLIPFTSIAKDGSDEKKISLDAGFTFELGQIVSGRYGEQVDPETHRHLWLDNICGVLDLKGRPFNWLELILGFEGRMWYNTFPTEETNFIYGTHDIYYSFYLTQAQGLFSFLQDRPFNVDMSFGFFPYKYNPEGRVFGDYLFRTGTYPVFIINKFDSPLARLGGLRLSFNYSNDLLGVRFDQLVISEREQRPLHDFTLASVLDVNIAKFIDLGVGVSFAHLIPVDKDLVTPKNPSNTIIYEEIDANNDTISDTLGHYTFKGTKLMFRGTIDPFAKLRGRSGFVGDLFGKWGGKLYSEIAIIGLKNYKRTKYADTFLNNFLNNNPFGYEKIKERMPMTFGLTLPCWKIFDVFAIELEYFNCPYPNSYKIVIQDGNPLPTIPNESIDDYNKKVYDQATWKGIIYMRKAINEHFSFMLQMGRDNMRWEVNGTHGPNFDFEDALVKTEYKDEEGKWRLGHWAWRFKTEFRF